jgi:hypothetical protein
LTTVTSAGALERLQLTAEPWHIQRRLGRGREGDQPGGTGVFLANLLQQRERLGRDPRFVRGEKVVELRNAERIGADAGKHRVLASAPDRVPPSVAGPTGRCTRERRKSVELRRLVTGREHERRVVVDG